MKASVIFGMSVAGCGQAPPVCQGERPRLRSTYAWAGRLQAQARLYEDVRAAARRGGRRRAEPRLRRAAARGDAHALGLPPRGRRRPEVVAAAQGAVARPEAA